jgi:hypothetical protein
VFSTVEGEAVLLNYHPNLLLWVRQRDRNKCTAA